MVEFSKCVSRAQETAARGGGKNVVARGALGDNNNNNNNNNNNGADPMESLGLLERHARRSQCALRRVSENGSQRANKRPAPWKRSERQRKKDESAPVETQRKAVNGRERTAFRCTLTAARAATSAWLAGRLDVCGAVIDLLWLATSLRSCGDTCRSG